MSDTDRERTGRGGPEPEGDRIAELIRLAGPRPDAPRARRERVEQAVRGHWKRETARRASWRPAVLVAPLAAAVLLAAVGLFAWQAAHPGARPPAATVEAVRAAADVKIESAGADARGPARATAGTALHAAQVVSTGSKAGLAIRMASGHSVRLAPSTRIELLDGTSLRLETGSLYVDSRRDGDPSANQLLVRSVYGDVVDIGTAFEVSVLTSALRVRVREGRVSVDGPGAAFSAGAGEAVEVSGSGAVARASIAPDDEAWAWAANLLPPIDLEELSLDAFLSWAAREGGWRVVYLDERIVRDAPATRLSGSIDGLPLDEALDAVLATCDAGHEVRDGDLRVWSTRTPAGG